MDGQTVLIQASIIEEKCQAFETLVIYCSTLGPRFAPYLPQCLPLTLLSHGPSFMMSFERLVPCKSHSSRLSIS